MDAKTTYLYASKGRVLLVCDDFHNEDHSHHALQLIINLELRPFTITHPSGELVSDCAIINANRSHQVSVPNTWCAMILIDPDSPAARRIRHQYLGSATANALPREAADFSRDRMRRFTDGSQPIELADEAISDIVDFLAGPETETPGYDPRITQLITRVQASTIENLDLARLARQCNLSESRLSHLFKAEVGIPIQRYLLWYKLYRAGFSICDGETMTAAAAAAGFADTAHFSRTFKAMFGLSPSRLFKTGRDVQVISDAI